MISRISLGKIFETTVDQFPQSMNCKHEKSHLLRRLTSRGSDFPEIEVAFSVQQLKAPD